MIALMERQMAKKKSKPSGRKIELVPDDLRGAADALVERVGELNRLAKLIQESSPGCVESDGPAQLERGLANIDAFIRNVKKAMINAGIG